MIDELKGFTKVEPKDLNLNAFETVGKDWLELVTGEPEGEVGAMTCSWGGFGYVWNKPVAFILVRGEEYRYTRHIMDAKPTFSLNFLPASQQKAKAYLGSAHGWDEPNKIEAAGLTKNWCGLDIIHNPAFMSDENWQVPFIEESDMVLVCETVCSQELPEETFVSKEVWERWYGAESQHRLYIAEIRGAYTRA